MTLQWKKLGQIFNPTLHPLPNGCTEFAQSPQPLIFDDFVRVYFSTRARDESGTYVSHVAFAEFDRQWKLLRVARDPVIPLGELGCFDEHGIFPMSVLRDGKRVLGYTTGWNRKKSTPNDSAIGLAISNDDGLTFKRVGPGPVLGPSLHEPFLVADGMVMKTGEVFHMWYIYGTRWIRHDESEPPDRVYKIGHATSRDGVAWQREGRAIIKDVLNGDECQALPSVVRSRGGWRMVFCYREAIGFRDQRGAGYRLGYAFSKDLVTWERNDAELAFPLSETGWDSEMHAYPFIFEMEGRLHLLYNGNQFGKFGFGVAVLQGEAS